MSLLQIIQAKEMELRRIKDHEIAAVFDAIGNIALEVHGGSSSVDLRPYIAQIQQLGGATLVHNHPLGWSYLPGDPRHGGSSFSPEDIATACYSVLSEIRAVGPQVRYAMRPAENRMWDGAYWENAVRPCLERHKLSVIRYSLQDVAESRRSREAAEADFWHEVWLRVAHDLGLIYRRFDDE